VWKSVRRTAVDVRRFFVGVRFCGVGLGVLRELGGLVALGSATNFNIASVSASSRPRLGTIRCGTVGTIGKPRNRATGGSWLVPLRRRRLLVAPVAVASRPLIERRWLGSLSCS
jgi:hypothetical protein